MLVARPADVGGDTLVDYDDDEQTRAASRPHAPHDGVATLDFDEAADLFSDAQGGGNFEDATRMHGHPLAIAPPARHAPMSDPFAGIRRGGDTMPIEDVASPLAAHDMTTPRVRGRAGRTLVADADGGNATLPVITATPISPVRPVAFAPIAPAEGDDTLPINHPPVAALAPIAPQRIAPTVATPPSDHTSQLPIVTANEHDRGFYIRLAAVTIVGGVVVGVVITLMLR